MYSQSLAKRLSQANAHLFVQLPSQPDVEQPIAFVITKMIVASDSNEGLLTITFRSTNLESANVVEQYQEATEVDIRHKDEKSPVVSFGQRYLPSALLSKNVIPAIEGLDLPVFIYVNGQTKPLKRICFAYVAAEIKDMSGLCYLLEVDDSAEKNAM